MKNLGYIQHLRRRQINEGWSERRMAQELGIGFATWMRIAHHQQEPTVSFLRSAMRRFPEYDPWVLEVVRGDVQRENEHGPARDTDELPRTGD